MFKSILFACLMCAITVSAVRAEEFTEASQTLCEKVKSCAMEQLQSANLPPQAREMMQPTLDTMCEQMQAKVGDVPTGHALYKPAVACMQSMNTLTCEMLQSPDNLATPECEEYEKLARESDSAG
jgi:hypothetical protein